MLAHYGKQNWWPGETAFEIMVGAVLTQNTNWANVEKAIANLKNNGCLDFEIMYAMGEQELALMIRSAGYYNLKARRLKNLLQMITDSYDGSIELLSQDDLHNARANLLAVKGIGPETADSILLYCCGQPIFVADAYTYRIFSRHNLLDEETDYYTIQQTFMDNMEHDAGVFNEYHALIVQTGKDYCKKGKPVCQGCPLEDL
ncbi:MAG: endonuclease [Deltaproteobacteria bacterium]|nr:MAG: endonuclease [Deltaproteobacteria bacterium]